jgi:serine/threonine protein kinase
MSIERSGEQIRNYVLHEAIGKGAFAAVYRATDLNLKRNVAIKIIHPHLADDVEMRRFREEAQNVANLQHPYIVTLHEFFVDENGAYIVMQLMSKGSLLDALTQQGCMTPVAVSRLLSQIAPALTLVHRNGIVHRDLKPANILLDVNNNAYIGDFGLAKWQHRDSSASESGDIIGTPRYLSPEQADRETYSEITGRADIYSLGIILFELLTGQHPFGDNQGIVEMILHHLRDELPKLSDYKPELPGELQEVLEKATAKHPDNRYDDAVHLAEAFQAAILEPSPNLFLRQTTPIGLPSEAHGDIGARVYKKPGAVLDNPRQLLGRNLLVAECSEWLDKNERILLHGLAGNGKTALAGRIAAEYLTKNNKAVVWIELGHQDFKTLFDAIARAFGRYQDIASKDGHERISAMRDILLEQDALLVIDNIWNEAAILPLLRAVPFSMPVLLTSRIAISIDGRMIDVEPLASEDAIALLEYHATKNYQDAAAVVDLCKSLGNHPYALEIAGKRLKTLQYLSPKKLLIEIMNAPHNLVQTGVLGQKSFKDLLDESINQLSPQLQHLLEMVGSMYVARSSVSLLSLIAGTSSDQMEAQLAELDRHGLLRLVASDDHPFHYRLHDLTYSYAHNLSKQGGGYHHGLINGVRKFLTVQVADDRNERKTNYDALDFDLLNILGAARAAYHADDNESLIDIMQQLVVQANYLTARGPSNAALELLQAAINAAANQENYEAAHYFTAKLGNVYFQLTGQFDLAVATYTKSLDFAKKMNDMARLALTHALVASARFRAGQDNVEWHYKEASRIAQESKSSQVIANIFLHRTFYAINREPPDYDAGKEFSNKIITLSKSKEVLADTLLSAVNNLAVCEQELGSLSRALKSYLEAFQLAEKINDQMWIARLADNVGRCYHRMDDRQQAMAYCGNALAIARKMDYPQLIERITRFAQEENYAISEYGMTEKIERE